MHAKHDRLMYSTCKTWIRSNSKKNECREYDLIGKDIVMSIMSGNATSSADQKCESATPIVVSVPSNFTHGYIMEYMEEFV